MAASSRRCRCSLPSAYACSTLQYPASVVHAGLTHTHCLLCSLVCLAAVPAVPRRDLEIQLKMEQVHIAPASDRLASHRSAGAGAGGAYCNYGERLYVEGRLDAMRKEQMVGGACCVKGWVWTTGATAFDGVCW